MEEEGVDEGEGEEGYEGPDVEHLGEVEGGNVIGFIAWDLLVGRKCVGCSGGKYAPRTTPPFQRIKMPKRAS